MNPSFVLYVGPMFSQKTSKMLSELDRCKFQHKNSVLFKPQLDTRYATNEVISHVGWRSPAINVTSGTDVLAYLADVEHEPDVIGVDEAFMIKGIADALIFLFRNGMSIVVSTLELSAVGKPFHEVEKMMVWATKIEKCVSVCTVCGKDAHYTYKKQVNEEEIQIGGSELYEPRCMRCHPLISVQDVG